MFVANMVYILGICMNIFINNLEKGIESLKHPREGDNLDVILGRMSDPDF